METYKVVAQCGGYTTTLYRGPRKEYAEAIMRAAPNMWDRAELLYRSRHWTRGHWALANHIEGGSGSWNCAS